LPPPERPMTRSCSWLTPGSNLGNLDCCQAQYEDAIDAFAASTQFGHERESINRSSMIEVVVVRGAQAQLSSLAAVQLGRAEEAVAYA